MATIEGLSEIFQKVYLTDDEANDGSGASIDQTVLTELDRLQTELVSKKKILSSKIESLDKQINRFADKTLNQLQPEEAMELHGWMKEKTDLTTQLKHTDQGIKRIEEKVETIQAKFSLQSAFNNTAEVKGGKSSIPTAIDWWNRSQKQHKEKSD